MTSVSRKEWGAKYGDGTVLTGGLKLALIHHTAGPDLAQNTSLEREKEVVRGIEKQHVEVNGWAGIGYNWLVFPSGRVYEGRGWRKRGAHCPNQNSKSVGISFVMNSELKDPTGAALQSCKDILALGLLGNHLAVGFDIKGHRDFDTTKCPGAKLYARLTELQETP